MTNPPDSDHTALLTWTQGHALQLTGIAPRALPGRGLGIVATRALLPEETVMQIPSTLLLTIYTPAVAQATCGLPAATTTVHARLAAALALREHAPEVGAEGDAVWRRTWPRREDFGGVPLMWTPQQQAELGEEAAGGLGSFLSTLFIIFHFRSWC
jgi:hypothetical protein